MKKTIPLLFFITVCIVDLLAIYFENKTVINWVKPLLMPSLFWYYYLSTKALNKLFVLGLFLSFLGDVFLLGESHLYFLLGLSSFLVAHVFYITMIVKLLGKTTFRNLVLATIPYLIVFVLLLNLLYDYLGEMKTPVLVYALTISVFGVVSILLYLQKKSKPALLLVAGVFLFVSSDAMLAINMFYKPQTYFPILIIASYVLAQFLICRFVLKLNSENDSSKIFIRR